MNSGKIIKSKEIGALMKKKRMELGITQEKLAEELKVSYQQVQRYENGSNRLNVENIQLIANLLMVPISYFFKEDKMTEEVSERVVPYLTSEEAKLNSLFKKIKKKENRSTVIEVAKLAID